MGSIIWTYLIDKSMAYPEFPNHDDFTAISKVLAGECEGEITVRGWIYRTRSSGKLAFIVIRDSTGSIQSTVSKKNVSESSFSDCLLYTSPSPRDATLSRMPSSA